MLEKSGELTWNMALLFWDGFNALDSVTRDPEGRK